MNPGDIVGPGEKPVEATQQTVASVAEPAPAPVVSNSPQPAEQEPAANWQFTAEDQTTAGATPPTPSYEVVTWSASEYMAHEKSLGWYVLLGLAATGAAGFIYLITREVVSTVVVLIMGLAFGSFAARKPEELTYELGNTALRVGQKTYPYAQFKSFNIIEEGAMHSITLMPLQRFMSPLSIYYDPTDEDKIATALSSYLPYEDRKQDAVDRLMRKVRF